MPGDKQVWIAMTRWRWLRKEKRAISSAAVGVAGITQITKV